MESIQQTMEKGRITILLATFNRATLIEETLDSIVGQSYTLWECIIVDDNSTDNTQEVVKKYLVKDHRFSYYLKREGYRKGLSGTRNYGLDLAMERGAEYIQFFDDDDLMHPHKLELQMKPFLLNPELNFTVCKYEKLVQEGATLTVVKPEFQMDFPHLGDAILSGSFKMNSLGPLWRSDFINQFRFDEALRYAEEWELYTRIGYQFSDNYAVVDEYLFQYRKHANSLTLRKDENYERRKTSAIVRIKILDFLSEKNLHTEESVKFLGKTFLIYSYSPNLVKRLLNYVENSGEFSFRIIGFLKIGLLLGRFNRKIITKLATWA